MSYPARRASYHPPTGWWDPFAELEAMRRRLDQLFAGLPAPGTGPEWPGDVDLEETDEGWLVEAPLPGVRPEAVDVELTERELSIRGEEVQATPRPPGDQSGRSRRRFFYRLPLPGEVDADRAEANLERGVLSVRLPRSPRAVGRRIPVGAGGTTGVSTGPATTGYGEAPAGAGTTAYGEPPPAGAGTTAYGEPPPAGTPRDEPSGYDYPGYQPGYGTTGYPTPTHGTPHGASAGDTADTTTGTTSYEPSGSQVPPGARRDETPPAPTTYQQPPATPGRFTGAGGSGHPQYPAPPPSGGVPPGGGPMYEDRWDPSDTDPEPHR